MGPTLQLLLLLGPITTALTKYVYVQQKTNWYGAHSHCETEYTDLAPINDESDINLLRALAGGYSGYIWIGLLRNMSDQTKWMWSGGAKATWFNWDSGQPEPPGDQNYVFLINFKWHDAQDYHAGHFLCYSVHVVREEKTWEEALEHCRTHYTDLATISSETELMLIQKELSKDASTDHVWMGLFFLSGEWFWMDGQVREYEAWGQGGKPKCPRVNPTCAALVVNSGKTKQWNAHDCQERWHFICY